MATTTFHLPAGLSPEVARELERACLAGGPDNMPYATSWFGEGNQITLEVSGDESSYLCAPWSIPDFGLLMGTSATLMQRTVPPYSLLVELARGKVNQVRGQLADWEAGGLQVDPTLRDLAHQAAIQFGQAVCSGDPASVIALSERALQTAYRAAEELIRAYTQQVFHIRHQRHGPLETILSTRLCPIVLNGAVGQQVRRAFNRVSLPLSWHVVEAEETTYRWNESDALLDWAEANELDVTAGPLLDFSSSQLPAWLWLWEQDLPSMATFMCRFVEAAVRRYRSRIRRWQLTAASNWATVLGLSEDELFSLTFRLCETARQVDPSLELVLGISQPWGEYMVPRERISPFIFADNLIRSGLNLSAINLELVQGVSDRGCYCRDPMDTSRLLDLYALLGVPLQVTMGYPAATGVDHEADPELRVGFGAWRSGFSPDIQAEWMQKYLGLALCKPYVQAVQWLHVSDATPHLFPHCGLLDGQGEVRPALEVLRGLREQHLR